MLSAAAVDLTTFDDDDWTTSAPAFHYRVASVSNSWGVTSIGRGFQWASQKDDVLESPPRPPKEPLRELPQVAIKESDDLLWSSDSYNHRLSPSVVPPYTMVTPTQPPMITTSAITTEPFSDLPPHSHPPSPRSPSAVSPAASPNRGPLSRSPSSPATRPRRRSSQQRVSLIAGRVSIAPMEPPSPPLLLAPSLQRAGSTSSYLSVAASTGPPTPFPERESFLGSRSISDFVIDGEIGRGAYGLVKRGREILADEILGPPLVIKQVIKSRILADCWKRHPKYGTIPIEIYVMSAISSTSYILPPRRPWNPSRLASQQHKDEPTNYHNRLESDNTDADDTWVEGKTVKGHPNICPLLDFFEDDHYYYLLLPSSTPERNNHGPPPPSDLFDLVEGYPHGLPANCIRSYVGQIADALCFLHSRGIVHRDVKDENVVLGPGGKCILIDFGSSGLVRKNGWDTFSGTLDYAGPEILRGERYHGKEQDVWAFGVVLYVLLVGECPFMTAAEAQEGLESPFANASIALDERCSDDKELEGEEEDGGGALGDAAALVRACLKVDLHTRPTFERIVQSRFLVGNAGW